MQRLQGKISLSTQCLSSDGEVFLSVAVIRPQQATMQSLISLAIFDNRFLIRTLGLLVVLHCSIVKAQLTSVCLPSVLLKNQKQNKILGGRKQWLGITFNFMFA